MNAYTDLITSEHAQRPKFVAMVEAVTGCFVGAHQAAQALRECFDIDTAVGVQLDAVGLWVGLSRRIRSPLAVYFSLDTPGLGLDEGSWKGPFDPDEGLVSLDDDTYRLFLKARVAANHWDGTIEGWKSVMDFAFAGSGFTVFMQDHQDMSMSIYVAGTLPPAILKELLTGDYLPLRPSGVRINGYFISSAPAPLFGFDIQNAYIAGFDTGAWGVPL